jgi:HIP---CoA ligase
MTLPSTIPAVLAEAATRFGDRPALIDGARVISFSGLLDAARSAASAFLTQGVGPGDRVAIWAPNSPEWILAALGAQMAGAAIVPINTRLKGREAGDILRRAKVCLLVTVETFLGVDYPAMIAGEDLPQLRTIVRLPGDGAETWTAFMASGAGSGAPAVDRSIAALSETDVSDILFTSGTTGAPKGVISAHGQVIALFAEWARIVDLREEDRMLIVNPFFHTFGYKAGWLACLIVGATMVPTAQFDVDQTLALIDQGGVSFVPGPPTLFQSLLSAPRENLDLSSLRVAVTGAANVPPSLVRRMGSELGFQRVVTGYGMTECGVIAMSRPDQDAEGVALTCGRVLPGLELRLVDDAGVDVEPGRDGEILVRGYGVMVGYLDDPVATAETIDAEGWLRTGDIGVLAPDATLRITDRKKDMYICGGFNCYPAEIEHRLCEHPGVAMAAVVGVPDERMGEVGKAFVVPRPGAQLTPEALIAWARTEMANYKAPRFVAIVADLPRNAAGKVLRNALRDEALNAHPPHATA